ncbi:MAG: tRNA uridine-5-carboxymethylaminomethyl(34) synthesis GTPase MnmE [Acidobacteria bacterium]|nr:MAG: tRNA uridine-5-carboxymethylaminomethyl(34) synthesis GTPase MnmE [Acidobacteriota bacterium]
MYVADDTIVALATPPGRGGLAVVRLSGPGALAILGALIEGHSPLEPRHATLVKVAGRDGTPRDEAVVTWFASPASYTGEDVVEISLHGSPVVAGGVVAAAASHGARVARPGEFTLRAFVNGKLDLAQAEAVRDLVSATTPLQASMAYDQLQGTLSERIGAIDRLVFQLAAKLEASIDFPEEGYHFVETGEVLETLRRVESAMGELLAESRRGRVLREGATVAVFGRPNVGKSTGFNRLAGSDRAIVTEIPGTTRDLLTESVSLQGVPVMLVDTAGARTSSDPVEREGVNRAARARDAADLALVVLDGSVLLGSEDERLLEQTASRSRLVVVNKSDLPARCELSAASLRSTPASREDVIRVSALTGVGFDGLVAAIVTQLTGSSSIAPAALSNGRHIQLLSQARERLQEASARLEVEIGQIPEEVILSELQATRQALEEITGQRTSDDLLEEIFSRFCVGK